MIQLGLVSAILPDKSLEELFHYAAENQFACLEIMCWPRGKSDRRYAGVTHIDVAQLDAQRLREIRAHIDDFPVTISALGYYPNPLDVDSERRRVVQEHLLSVIRAAAMLEIPVVNTFIGRNQFLNLEENFRLFQVEWQPILEQAKAAGVKIGIENCPMLFTYDEWPGGRNLAISPAIWTRMFELFPSDYFGLNFDPSHFIWQQMDYIKPLYDFKDKLFHIHLKDVKLYREKLDQTGIMVPPNQYSAPKIPGYGDVHWGRFFSALTDIGYRGAACIEVEDRAFEGSVADVLTGITTARQYLRQFVCL